MSLASCRCKSIHQAPSILSKSLQYIATQQSAWHPKIPIKSEVSHPPPSFAFKQSSNPPQRTSIQSSLLNNGGTT